jgi:hypothetical protein
MQIYKCVYELEPCYQFQSPVMNFVLFIATKFWESLRKWILTEEGKESEHQYERKLK